MRRIVVLVLFAAALAGCAERRPDSLAEPDPSPAESPAESPAQEREELAGASCENINAGEPANLPRFVAVDAESESGVDRITFTFEPQGGAPEEPPWHFVGFVDELMTEGEGRPVHVDGNAFLLVSFQAIGVDLSGEEPVEVYTGPKRLSPGFGTLKEAVHLGDFEAQVSWGLGLASRECFVLEAERDHLTLEFASA